MNWRANWKTTAAGMATAFFAFVAFSPEYFPVLVVKLAQFAAAGGMAGLGLLSKDFDVHGNGK